MMVRAADKAGDGDNLGHTKMTLLTEQNQLAKQKHNARADLY